MGKKLTVKVWMVMGAAVMVLGGAASARADQEVAARVLAIDTSVRWPC